MPIPPSQRVAYVAKRVDVARDDGAQLARAQRELGVSTIEAARLLFEAWQVRGRPRPVRGSVMRNLLDSDSPGSFPFAAREPFDADTDAPVIATHGSARIGRYAFPRLGLGCMRLVSKSVTLGKRTVSALGIPHSPEATRHAVLNAVLHSGLRYVDVSRGYGPWPGAGEGILRDWLSPLPADLVFATKVGYRRGPLGDWLVDLDPRFIAAEVKASVAQFGARVPVVYLVVKSTPTTPVRNRPTDLRKALAPLVRAQKAGLVEHIGIANVSDDDARALLDTGAVSVVQNRFSLASLGSAQEQAVMKRCAQADVPFVMWGIFGEGARRPDPPRALVRAARDREVSVEELTIAVLLALAPHVVALPGPGRRESIESCIFGANLRVDEELVARVVAEVGAPKRAASAGRRRAGAKRRGAATNRRSAR